MKKLLLLCVLSAPISLFCPQSYRERIKQQFFRAKSAYVSECMICSKEYLTEGVAGHVFNNHRQQLNQLFPECITWRENELYPSCLTSKDFEEKGGLSYCTLCQLIFVNASHHQESHLPAPQQLSDEKTIGPVIEPFVKNLRYGSFWCCPCNKLIVSNNVISHFVKQHQNILLGKTPDIIKLEDSEPDLYEIVDLPQELLSALPANTFDA